MRMLITSDLDGTLLNSDHEISEFTVETLRRLHEQGPTFAFATDLHHVDVVS